MFSSERLFPWGAALLVLAASLGAYGCTLLVSSDVVQCKVNADCAARGFANTSCVANVCVAPHSTTPPTTDAGSVDATTDDAEAADPVWGCIGNVQWGVQDISQKVWVRQRFLRLTDDSPVTTMTVTACGRLDPTCSSPFGSGVTDDAGYLNLDIAKYFQGSFYLATPASFPGMAASIITVVPPPGASADLDASIDSAHAAHLASTLELDEIAASLGVQNLNPSLGEILGLALDCQGNPAAGVTLYPSVKDPSSVQYYSDTDGVPSLTAVSTSQVGEAGIINSATGSVTITATVAALGKQMGTYTIAVSPNTVTYLPLPPTPL